MPKPRLSNEVAANGVIAVTLPESVLSANTEALA
jgi:hypothetical protein